MLMNLIREGDEGNEGTASRSGYFLAVTTSAATGAQDSRIKTLVLHMNTWDMGPLIPHESVGVTDL